MRFTIASLAALFASAASFADTTDPVLEGVGEETVLSDPDNWRAVAAENLFIFETTKGRILIEAMPWAAPRHVTQFRNIIRSGDYDGTSFHRVISDFMAQGGDIEALHGRPSGLPNIPPEFTFRREPDSLPAAISTDARPQTGKDRRGWVSGWIEGAPINSQSDYLADHTPDGRIETFITHCPGVVSTARTDDPTSANSQFFLMREYSPHLDQIYTSWGRVVSGVDVVRDLKPGSQDNNGIVSQPDILISARVAADVADAQRPRVWVQRIDGVAFATALDGAERDPVCDMPPVPTIVVG